LPPQMVEPAIPCDEPAPVVRPRSVFCLQLSARYDQPFKSVAPEFTMRLSLRHTGLAPPDPNRRDYVVIDDGREVGRLHENPYDPPELRWFWSIIVIGAHQAGIRTNGRAATPSADRTSGRAARGGCNEFKALRV
jgi:hypothetical protein